MKNTNLAFGIGDELYNAICDDCRKNLYDMGLEAVKALNKTIAIELEDDMFVIDVYIDDLHSSGYEFEDFESAFAFITGLAVANRLKDLVSVEDL